MNDSESPACVVIFDSSQVFVPPAAPNVYVVPSVCVSP